MKRCEVHIDSSQWVDQPHPTRAGWIVTTCRVCGAFIGNRPNN